jgi:hypothetical protein
MSYDYTKRTLTVTSRLNVANGNAHIPAALLRCEFRPSLLIVQRRIAMGYYKRIPVYRNPFLKRLSFRFAYMKPSKITFLTCLLILLAGAVMALSVENMLPENFAEIVMAQISEMGL